MKCLIFAGMPVSNELCSRYADADYIIAADAGYQNAENAGIIPDLYLGDYDSAPCPQRAEQVIVLPTEKDDTDTFYAVRTALEAGADEIVILGGLGGRLDHTLANLQTLVFLAKQGVKAVLADENNEVTVLLPGTHSFPARKGWYFSVFSAGEAAENVTLSGLKYTLCGGRLENTYPVGISNEFAGSLATVEFSSGIIFAILSRKENTK